MTPRIYSRSYRKRLLIAANIVARLISRRISSLWLFAAIGHENDVLQVAAQLATQQVEVISRTD